MFRTNSPLNVDFYKWIIALLLVVTVSVRLCVPSNWRNLKWHLSSQGFAWLRFLCTTETSYLDGCRLLKLELCFSHGLMLRTNVHQNILLQAWWGKCEAMCQHLWTALLFQVSKQNGTSGVPHFLWLMDHEPFVFGSEKMQTDKFVRKCLSLKIVWICIDQFRGVVSNFMCWYVSKIMKKAK